MEIWKVFRQDREKRIMLTVTFSEKGTVEVAVAKLF